jgi:hypothetical protein
LVISSRAVGFKTTRSPRGRSFEVVFEAVFDALANVFPPGTTEVVERLLCERRVGAGDPPSGRARCAF